MNRVVAVDTEPLSAPSSNASQLAYGVAMGTSSSAPQRHSVHVLYHDIYLATGLRAQSCEIVWMIGDHSWG